MTVLRVLQVMTVACVSGRNSLCVIVLNKVACGLGGCGLIHDIGLKPLFRKPAYSVVCIGTQYGPNGSEIELRWGRDFPHAFRPALGPTELPVQWVPCHAWR